MKVCNECQVKKPLDGFYKHAAMADGHLNKCIDCVRARIAKHREANLEKIREYDRRRSNQLHRVKAREEYSKTEAGKRTKKRAMDAYKKRYPMIYASHIVTNNAMRDGKLSQASNCSICKSTEKIEGHHDDYTKPLAVRWLCEQCHKEWHRHNKPIYE